MKSLSTSQTVSQSRRFFTVTQWSNHHSWPSTGGLRHLIFFSKTNGFEKVIRRSGKRILIDERAFFEWIDSKEKQQKKKVKK